MRKTIIIPFGCIIMMACNNNPTDNPAKDSLAVNIDTVSKEPFYPIAQYINDQLAYVDSTPLAIEKHTMLNGKRVDSVIISRPEMKQLAAEFMYPDLNEKQFKPLYQENSFKDLTLNTVTFNYTSKGPGQELLQADVLLDMETKKVKNVMFRKARMAGDTSISINGLWNNNMNFQLNYSIQPPSGPAINKQVKVIWDRPMQ